jgi:transposase-like protein
MPSRQPDKPKLTPELKQELIKRVAELKIEGKSYNAISNELGICFNSAMKYWQIHLKENSKIDLDELLLDRQATTERLVQKAVRDHHEGKVPIKDVEIAMNLADRYNGLALKIMSAVAQDMPVLLQVAVHNIDVEMPPGEEKLIEQVLEVVE